MATATGKARCIICGKDRSAVRCEGCLQIFCYNHLTDHRQELNKQFDEIEVNRDIFRQTLTQQTTDLDKHSLIKHIDEWEDNSIKKIQEIAEEHRTLVLQHITEHMTQMEINLGKLTEELRETRQENDFNEIDLKQFTDKLAQLAKELDQPSNVSIQQDSASPVNKIAVVISSSKELSEKSQEQQQTNQSREERHTEYKLLQNEIEVLRNELNEKSLDQQAYTVLKTSFTEIEKRCVKHQKTEIEVRRQLTVYENFINDLQRKIQDLTEKLSAGAEEYKILFHKYTLLERKRQLGKQNQEKKTASTGVSFVDVQGEEAHCPMCFWEFPRHMTTDGKKEHIEQHFQ